MSGKKIITVFGATGSQGGGVVSTFLSDPKLNQTWAVRGVTRDVSKDSAKRLAERGVEVVAADLDDKASLVKAMQGSYAVFSVTNYWEYIDAEREVRQGKNLADAAKEAGVRHYIWSSVLNITKLSNGKLSRVYHFDSKADVEEYVRELGIPASFFMAGFYMGNLPGQIFRPSPPPDNAWTLWGPFSADTAIPLYDPRDTGKYIKAMVLNEAHFLNEGQGKGQGRRFTGATAYVTAREIVDTFRSVFPEAGATARFVRVSEEQFHAHPGGFPAVAATELYENMRLLEEFGYYGGEPLENSLRFVEAEGDTLTSWADFARGHEVFAGLK